MQVLIDSTHNREYFFNGWTRRRGSTVTVEYQRQQAKEMQKYFRQLKNLKAVESAK